jgi:hypothetical protein
MLLAQVLIVAFAVTLLVKALPFGKAAAAPVAAPESDAKSDGRSNAKSDAKSTTPAVSGTGSPWHLKFDRAQLPATLGGIVGLLALIPWSSGAFSGDFSGTSPAMALRGLWGDPSITSLQLLFLVLVSRTPSAFATGWRAPAVIAAIAALFYPLALGATDFDPYRLGYTPLLLVLPLGIAAVTLWRRGQSLWLWLLAIDLLAWTIGLLESPNLWDTLLDPLLAVACLILAVRNGWRTYRKTKT